MAEYTIEAFESHYYWNELPEKFTFLDGTPCGKLTEESNVR